MAQFPPGAATVTAAAAPAAFHQLLVLDLHTGGFTRQIFLSGALRCLM